MGLIMNRQIHKVFLYRETGAITVRCAYFFHKLYSLSLSSLNDKIQNLVYVFTIININYPTTFPNMLICFIDNYVSKIHVHYKQQHLTSTVT